VLGCETDVAKWPFRCTWITESKVASSILKLIASRMMPALLTRMSSRPIRRRLLDELARAVPGRDVATVGGGEPARRDDLVDDRVGRTRVAAVAFHRGAEVVDDDSRPVRGEQERVATTDAPAAAGDDRDLALEDAHPTLPALEPECGARHEVERVRVSP